VIEMERHDASAVRETDGVAAADARACEADEVFDQRCVSERPEDIARLRALETRIGDVLNTPFVSLMSQIALELKLLI
jgi:hypothetical protein